MYSFPTKTFPIFNEDANIQTFIQTLLMNLYSRPIHIPSDRNQLPSQRTIQPQSKWQTCKKPTLSTGSQASLLNVYRTRHTPVITRHGLALASPLMLKPVPTTRTIPHIPHRLSIISTASTVSLSRLPMPVIAPRAFFSSTTWGTCIC